MNKHKQIISSIREEVWKMQSSAEIENILKAMWDGLHQLEVPFTYFGFHLLDEQASPPAITVYIIEHQSPFLRKQQFHFSDLPVLVRIWRDQKLAHRADLHAEDPFGERTQSQPHVPVRSLMDAPLPQGTLAISSTEPRAFSERDQELLQDMAQVMSEVFRRLEDLKNIDRHSRELERELTERRQIEKKKDVIQQVRDEVWKMQTAEDIRHVSLKVRSGLMELGIQFDAFGINMIVDSSTPCCRFHAYGFDKNLELFVNENLPDTQNAITAEIWQGKQPAYRPDIAVEDAYREYPFLEEWQIRSVLDVPFSHGTLAISSRQPHAFSDEGIGIVQELGEVLSEGFQRMDDFRILEQRNQELRKYAETQQVLLREVNHRVKNNLSAIISMLHMEEDRANSAGLVSYLPLLGDLVSRIQGLSTVHSLLSASDWRSLELSHLCEQVINATIKGLLLSKKVEVSIRPSPVRVGSNQAHQLALVINELATNSIKYALEDRATAAISVGIDRKDGRISIRFQDDGPGYPEEILRGEFQKTGIGFELIRGIITQTLDGEVEFSNDSGAAAIIHFEIELENDSEEGV